MRGGKRPGAGRKKGFAAQNAEESRRYMSERVAAEIGVLTDVLIKKAKQGDLKAMSLLLDRAFGRPADEPKRLGFVFNASEFREKYRAT